MEKNIMPSIDAETAEQIARLLDRGAIYSNGDVAHESYWFRDGMYVVERGDRRRWEDTREVQVLDSGAFLELLVGTAQHSELLTWVRENAHLCTGSAA